MSNLEIKGSLFDLLWAVDDTRTLLKIRQYVFNTLQRARQEEADWWDELSPEQQQHLDRVLKEAEKSLNLISHDQLLAEVEAKFKTITNGI